MTVHSRVLVRKGTAILVPTDIIGYPGMSNPKTKSLSLQRALLVDHVTHQTRSRILPAIDPVISNPPEESHLQ